MTDLLEAITNLLAEDQGIPCAKLRPTARLRYDLGVDGDDASDLFQRLHERFGTDFSSLTRQWDQFFKSEGASLRSILLTMLLLIPSTALTFWIAASLELGTGLAGIMGIVIFFATRIAVSYVLPGKPKRSVTIGGLAKIVRAGAWPDSPASVR